MRPTAHRVKSPPRAAFSWRRREVEQSKHKCIVYFVKVTQWRMWSRCPPRTSFQRIISAESELVGWGQTLRVLVGGAGVPQTLEEAGTRRSSHPVFALFTKLFRSAASEQRGGCCRRRRVWPRPGSLLSSLQATSRISINSSPQF